MKILLLLALLSDANAPVISLCDVVRSYVAMYGEAEAIKWAEKHKWSKARIAEARACLVR